MSRIRDFVRDYRIDTVKSKAGITDIRARSNTADIDYLDSKLEGLMLIAQAMWELLEANGFSEKALEEKIREIDARDGALDGKLSTTMAYCASCGKAIKKRRANCYWCGASLKKDGIV